MDLVEKYIGEKSGWAKPSGNFAGWIAIYGGKKLEIKKGEAKDLWGAKQLAMKKLKVPKSKQGLLAIDVAYESTNLSEEKVIQVVKGKKTGEAILKVPGKKDKTYKAVSIAAKDAKELGKKMNLRVVDKASPVYSGSSKGFKYFE
jgi:hypothetical protein